MSTVAAIRERPLPFVSDVEHRWIPTPRLTVHVAEAGAGPAVVLLHGWPEHWYAWHKVMPLLARTHRVICPDLRGCGWSDAPAGPYGTETLVDDTVGLLDALELDNVSVIGHDIGGRVGFQLCLRAPNRIVRFVAINTVHPYWSPRLMARHAWRYWWTIPIETPFVGRFVLRRIPAYTRLLFRLGNGNRHQREPAEIGSFLEALREPVRARAAERLQGDFAYREIVPALLGLHRLPRLTVPTLMMNGTRDFAISPNTLGGHEDHADDLRSELVADGGHFLPEEHPDLVAAASLAWICASRSTRATRLETDECAGPTNPAPNTLHQSPFHEEIT